jgi:anti-sigma regulatory factor (Ser/Thr protein kinase)
VADVVDDLRRMISEPVSTAVLHARTAIDVAVSIGEGVIELRVRDHNPRTDLAAAAVPPGVPLRGRLAPGRPRVDAGR